MTSGVWNNFFCPILAKSTLFILALIHCIFFFVASVQTNKQARSAVKFILEDQRESKVVVVKLLRLVEILMSWTVTISDDQRSNLTKENDNLNISKTEVEVYLSYMNRAVTKKIWFSVQNITKKPDCSTIPCKFRKEGTDKMDFSTVNVFEERGYRVWCQRQDDQSECQYQKRKYRSCGRRKIRIDQGAQDSSNRIIPITGLRKSWHGIL